MRIVGEQILSSRQSSDPADASAGKMVEAGHDSGDMEWVGNIERPVPAQTNPFGGANRRTHQRERIKPHASGTSVARCFERGIRHAEDDGVEIRLLRANGRLDQGSRLEDKGFIHPPRSGMPAVLRNGEQKPHGVTPPQSIYSESAGYVRVSGSPSWLSDLPLRRCDRF